jgi:hypothetical protein
MEDAQRLEKFQALLVQHEFMYQDTSLQFTTIRAVTANHRADRGGRGGGRGGGGLGGGGRGGGGNGPSCTWCATLFGKSGLQGPPAGGSCAPGHSAAAVPVGATGVPAHNTGPCSRPGEDLNAWKLFGPKPT